MCRARTPAKTRDGSSRLAAAMELFCDREHGSKHNQVPVQWRKQRSLWSAYAWSSFAYSVTGVVYLVLLHRYPSKALHAGESLDAVVWIWQGGISFMCDYVDLGVPSWSHPVDRISATAVILWQTIKFFLFLSAWSWRMLLHFPPALAFGLWSFRMSCAAVSRRDAPAYFFWHTVWHFVLPVNGVIFYVMRFCT